ncbi:MAG: hypothetical protein K1X94_24830, partial [Sandaracinaceae bacterium]|nr:hypothetical protein [Sandaracinaceae bacterium]
GAGPLERGAPTLAWLSRRIDTFAERDVSAREEAEFVEGAGALLAAVLVDHVGLGAHAERDGVHRLRLGTHGFFDPFQAIETALASSSARAALVQEVARAEAEASGVAGHGRVSQAFEKVLSDVRPDLAIDARFEGRLWLSTLDSASDPESAPVEVDLARVVALADGQSDASVEVAVKKLVAMLPGGAAPGIDRDDAIARLLPRVVGAHFDLRDTLFARSLPNGTRLCLTLAYDGRARFVRSRELPEWLLEPDEAVLLSLENLAKRSVRARFARIETFDGPVVFARTGDGLDSARIVLPGLVDVLAPELGEPFVAAVPHRDVLYACRSDAPRSFDEMMARVADDFAKAPHRISDKPFLVDRAGLRPY